MLITSQQIDIYEDIIVWSQEKHLVVTSKIKFEKRNID